MKKRALMMSMIYLWTVSLIFSGCSGKQEENGSPAETVSGSSGEAQEDPALSDAPLQNQPEDSGQNVDQMGEGTAPGNLPDDSDVTPAETGEALVFSRDGQDLYSVTVESAGFTERRAVAETTAPEKVLLVTYSYVSLSGEAVLVDDMSFQCYDEDGGLCIPYYLADQITAEPNSGGEPARAEAAFSVPADMQEAELYVTGSSDPAGGAYRLTLYP